MKHNGYWFSLICVLLSLALLVLPTSAEAAETTADGTSAVASTITAEPDINAEITAAAKGSTDTAEKPEMTKHDNDTAANAETAAPAEKTSDVKTDADQPVADVKPAEESSAPETTADVKAAEQPSDAVKPSSDVNTVDTDTADVKQSAEQPPSDVNAAVTEPKPAADNPITAETAKPEEKAAAGDATTKNTDAIKPETAKETEKTEDIVDTPSQADLDDARQDFIAVMMVADHQAGGTFAQDIDLTGPFFQVKSHLDTNYTTKPLVAQGTMNVSFMTIMGAPQAQNYPFYLVSTRDKTTLYFSRDNEWKKITSTAPILTADPTAAYGTLEQMMPCVKEVRLLDKTRDNRTFLVTLDGKTLGDLIAKAQTQELLENPGKQSKEEIEKSLKQIKQYGENMIDLSYEMTADNHTNLPQSVSVDLTNLLQYTMDASIDAMSEESTEDPLTPARAKMFRSFFAGMTLKMTGTYTYPENVEPIIIPEKVMLAPEVSKDDQNDASTDSSAEMATETVPEAAVPSPADLLSIIRDGSADASPKV